MVLCICPQLQYFLDSYAISRLYLHMYVCCMSPHFQLTSEHFYYMNERAESRLMKTVIVVLDKPDLHELEFNCLCECWAVVWYYDITHFVYPPVLKEILTSDWLKITPMFWKIWPTFWGCYASMHIYASMCVCKYASM